MENSAGKSGGAESSRKNRSLDLHSLYKSTVSVQQGNNKTETGVVDDEEGFRKKKKRKSRREVSLRSLESAGKKSRDSLDEGDGAGSDSPDSGNLQSWLSRKLGSTSRFNGISLNLDDDGGGIVRIPKRRRGFVGRKRFESTQVSRSLRTDSRSVGGYVDPIAKLNGECKEFDGNQVSKSVGRPDGEVSSADQVSELNDDSASKIVHPKVKGKRGFDELKVNRSSRVNSAKHAKEEDGHLIVNNGDASSYRKRCRNHRKRKDLAPRSESLAKKVEPPADSSNKICHNSQDEDEEDNLEQNAARMLSSRFDPSCTGVPSTSRSFASPSRNGSSSVVPSGKGFVSRGVNSLAGLDSASADAASRILRPRKHDKRGLFRKRRHFYEIFPEELDAYWVLNRRIKIFWPLDESWYYGLVNDYDPERDLHHIKYDDRDEEWINLRNERFKLLVFPSEIPRKTQAERGTRGYKQDNNGKSESAADDDSFVGSYTDSEPIISWLARSSRQVKSSPLGVLKRRKTSHLSSDFVPLRLSSKTDDALRCFDTDSSGRDMNKASNSALPDGSTDTRKDKKSVLEGTRSSKDFKSPVVYFRRRFRKKDEPLFNEPKGHNACGSTPLSVTSLAPVVQGFRASKVDDILGLKDNGELLWSVDNLGLLKLNICLVESKQLRFELSSSVPVPWYIGAENSWLLRTMLLLHYGTVTTTWPKIHLEILVVDNFVGLRFLLFEGSLKQVVTFVFLILTVFYQPNEQRKYADIQMPVTSVRFKLSCIGDLRKQHVFAFFVFSKVKKSKWLYLDCKLQQHCLLTKQLPVSECTYDNIKALEGGCNQMHTSSVDREPSAFEGLRKKSLQSIITLGASKESSSRAMNQYSSNSDVKHGKFLPFALSFSAAPTFFLSLHLKLLMENSVAGISLQDHDLMHSLGRSENRARLVADGCNLIQDCSKSVSEITPECNPRTSLRKAESRRWLLRPETHLGPEAILECNDGGLVKSKSSQVCQNGNLSVGETSACCRDQGENLTPLTAQSQKSGCSSLELEPCITSPEPLVAKDHVSGGMPDSRCYSRLAGLSVEIPFLDQVEMPANGKTPSSTQSSDLAWNVSDAIGHNLYPTGPRSIWHQNRNSFSSSSGDASRLWPNGKVDFIRNGFGNGPKKPRTQVHYTLPSGVFEYSGKHKMHSQKGLHSKRIRKASEKRTLDVSRNSHRNPELLACHANVLITIGDRGWRECGARVVLELADHNEWRLAVKLTGSTKYSYKAHQFLQPGSTNRYTHAMMWKGGKDWVLEFPDRSQWILFKEMHEECYNRNIRAASVKNIPIPGVRLVEESDDNETELPFIRSSPMYFQQVETDVDMAMDPLRLLYDMDSDDERWISENQRSSLASGSKCEEISEELLEKMMDMFEKVSYAEQRDHFEPDEMEKFMVGGGTLEAIKLIYEHWRLKRQRKGMPLIRHLQPPLWERYEQQVKEWEHAMAKANTTLSDGCQDKALPMEKPPIFAFCLKPRGLEVPNRGSKQRSHRKVPVSGHSHAILDHDGLLPFGRRSNGFAFGDERVMFQGNSHESSDASPLFQSSRVFSPRDASGSAYFSSSNDWGEWNHPKFHRNKSKKIGTILSPNSPYMVASYNQRTIGKRNGGYRWNMGLPEWPSQKHYPSEVSLRHSIEQLDGSDLDEFRLRDASGAAQHALNMAKLKREKAQRLLYRADLAIHKAVVALTTAEAIKASSSEDSNCVGQED